MLLCIGLLLFCAGVIYLACELFVNGIEWLGARLNMGATAVGTVLAAFGTALPESVITLVAVLFGENSQERDIGVGAAMGGPLVLATLAYGIVGGCFLARYGWAARKRSLDADISHLRSDSQAFLWIYGAKISLGAWAFTYKPYCSTLFVAAYGLYLWRELRRVDAPAEASTLEALRFAPKSASPSTGKIVLQVVLSIAAISAAANLFVDQLTLLGGFWKLPPHVVALLLSPVATELPEILNAMIWVRQGKQRLALANISGSMMIQATIPSALGLAFTPWLFDGPLWAAAVVTTGAIALLLTSLVQGRLTAGRLLLAPTMYVLFAAYLLVFELIFE